MSPLDIESPGPDGIVEKSIGPNGLWWNTLFLQQVLQDMYSMNDQTRQGP